jgi:antitoxin CcdA
MRMTHAQRTRALERTVTRAPTNVTLDTALVAEARDLGVNISRASAAGLERAVAQARAERWLRENGPALRSSNAFVEAHGLPLKNLRRF